MSHFIIDRRKNPGGKSITNRQKFLEKYKRQIKENVRESIKKGKIENIGENGAVISVPLDDLSEPSFEYDRTSGKRDYISPYNPGYNEGDKIEKQKGGGGKGSSSGQASDFGEGEDSFQFHISKDEFFNIFFEDLELPNLAKKRMEELEQTKLKRAGYTNFGSPSKIDIKQTFKKSYMRKISLNRPDELEIEELEERIKNEKDEKKKKELLLQLEEMKRKIIEIPYLDEMDLKIRNYNPKPNPSNRAVMFAIMDVSASMDEKKKELAKIFFFLLYTFLTKKYQKVSIVFIRHHSEAEEVNEEEFFHKKSTGGTLVSTALELALKIIKERYPTDEWNIYFAQCSDGDNFDSDNPKTLTLMKEIMKICQYYAYVEIDLSFADYHLWDVYARRTMTSLWKTYKTIDNPILQMSVVRKREDIWVVFRELFSSQSKKS